MFHEMTLDQAPIYATVVSQLSQDNSLSTKLQTYFYNALKKPLSKKSVKGLSFENQYSILEALPPAESAADQYTSTKSIHYLLLNDMLTPSPHLAESWETLEKDQVLHIAERCKELSKCRDINNKLRGALLNIKTHTFNLEDFKRLFMILSESGVGSHEK